MSRELTVHTRRPSVTAPTTLMEARPSWKCGDFHATIATSSWIRLPKRPPISRTINAGKNQRHGSRRRSSNRSATTTSTVRAPWSLSWRGTTRWTRPFSTKAKSGKRPHRCCHLWSAACNLWRYHRSRSKWNRSATTSTSTSAVMAPSGLSWRGTTRWTRPFPTKAASGKGRHQRCHLLTAACNLGRYHRSKSNSNRSATMT